MRTVVEARRSGGATLESRTQPHPTKIAMRYIITTSGAHGAPY
jgi:hypothetical protein